MPSGQPTLFYKSSKCLQILTKMRFLYALWTANLVSQVLKLLADINKNEISVCPLGFFRDDFSTLLERFQNMLWVILEQFGYFGGDHFILLVRFYLIFANILKTCKTRLAVQGAYRNHIFVNICKHSEYFLIQGWLSRGHTEISFLLIFAGILKTCETRLAVQRAYRNLISAHLCKHVEDL